MNKKVIAIGNKMMGDDGIGIAVAEHLQEFFWEHGFEVIIGETDVLYCFNSIDEGDFLIILDSSNIGFEPGQVKMMSIKEAIKKYKICPTQHECNLLTLLGRYEMEVSGAVMCIEVYKIELHWGLSQAMEGILPLVCENVKEKIRHILGEG